MAVDEPMNVTTAFDAKSLGSQTARNTVMLLRYMLDTQPAPDGYMECSRRQLTRALPLTERELRTALKRLHQCGWLERRPGGKGTSAHYRLTPAFAEFAETTRVRPHHMARRHGNGETHMQVPANGTPEFAEHLRGYAWQHLMQRLLTLNERPKRYGRGYSKPVLRGTAIALHWFIRQNEPIVVASLRGLAQETGLTFRSAKHARARLIAWGLLTEQDGALALDYARLAQLLFEDRLLLPPTPAIHRHRGRHHDR